MGNIIDYVRAVGDRTFAELPFNPVDSLVLSQTAYLQFHGLVPGPLDPDPPVTLSDVLDDFRAPLLYTGVFEEGKSRQLLDAMVSGCRFRDLRLSGFVSELDPEEEKQFAAITLHLGDGSVYVAFRGTDANIVGWKEDFNMAFLCPVPAQTRGVEYLKAAARATRGPIHTGGHSKGGNLAVYAAMKAGDTVRQRIIGIYSHDGPGFLERVMQDPDYISIRERVHKYLPQSSVIGMLLQHQEAYRVVESRRFWILQHDPFSWQVDGSDFRYEHALRPGAEVVSGAIRTWLSSIDDTQRERFVDTIYQVIHATEAQTLSDLIHSLRGNAVAMVEAIRDIDPETKSFVLRTVYTLVSTLARDLTRSQLHRFRDRILNALDRMREAGDD